MVAFENFSRQDTLPKELKNGPKHSCFMLDIVPVGGINGKRPVEERFVSEKPT